MFSVLNLTFMRYGSPFIICNSLICVCVKIRCIFTKFKTY